MVDATVINHKEGAALTCKLMYFCIYRGLKLTFNNTINIRLILQRHDLQSSKNFW